MTTPAETTPSETTPANPLPARRATPIERPGYWYFDPAPAPEAAPPPVLIGLHGYAQTGPDFLTVTRKLAGPAMAACAPQGSNQLWQRENAAIVFAWLTSFERDHSVRANNAFLGRVIDELAAEGSIDPRGVYLMGFSQGSSVAYRFALEHPDRVAGILSMCADLPPDVEKRAAELRGVPVFVAYGTRDPIFPQDKPNHAAAALRAAGVDVELVSFDRGHVIPSSIAPRVQEWIARNEADRLRRARLAVAATRLGV